MMEGGDGEAYRIMRDMENVDTEDHSFFLQIADSSKGKWS